jgi:peptide-methionine (S)-S-oxide reductase
MRALWLLTVTGWLGMGAVAMAQESKATFAGGCFWCMEPEFAALPGVSKVTSGYTGGQVKNPTYEQVSSGATGHVEAIEIVYDPAKTSYQQLLDIFWQNIDPLDEYGQFCDKGSQYRAGIFTHDAEQKKLAEQSKEKVAKMFSKPLATVIRDAVEFYPAEDYHQEYYIKSKTRYKMYRMGCGRDSRLDELWKGKKPPSASGQ